MAVNQPVDNLAAVHPINSAGQASQPPARQAIAAPEDYAYCRKVMRGASKNYSFASRFLPPEKPPHVEALYAFMRVGDDRVDVSSPASPAPGLRSPDPPAAA